MSRSNVKTVPIHELPTLLGVGLSAGLLDRCRDAAALHGAIVKTAPDPGAAGALATQLRPLAIVVTWAAYDANKASFDALAASARSALVRVPREDVEVDELAGMVGAALDEAKALRA